MMHGQKNIKIYAVYMCHFYCNASSQVYLQNIL